MKVCVVGTGYVGLVTGVCLAESGNEVWCIDIDAAKVDRLQRGELPIYEPGLQELLERVLREKRIHFSTELKVGFEPADICFITVDTPSDENGQADISRVLSVAKQIGSLLTQPKIIVLKSTVPVGTHCRVQQIIRDGCQAAGRGEIS